MRERNLDFNSGPDTGKKDIFTWLWPLQDAAAVKVSVAKGKNFWTSFDALASKAATMEQFWLEKANKHLRLNPIGKTLSSLIKPEYFKVYS